MKQTIFTLLLFSALGLISCKKNNVQLNIRQYDLSQVQNYISSNGITGMVRDTSGGDTTGMYYKIITPGDPSQPLSDTTKVSFVFSLRSFDGKYSNVDTIENHFCNYIGHIVGQDLPLGLQVALLSDLKYNGGSMRILIPSRMAYGVYGFGTGSSSNPNSHIAGNQCLDYYVHCIINEPGYDDLVIQNYIKAQSLTNYTRTADGVYYKINHQGTGIALINQNSIIEATYTGILLDNIVFDSANNGADSVSLQVPNLLPGVQEALSHATGGDTDISMIIPSGLAYGQNTSSGTVTIPVNSCLRFEFRVISNLQ